MLFNRSTATLGLLRYRHYDEDYLVLDLSTRRRPATEDLSAPVTFTKCHGMVCMRKIGWQVDMPVVDRPSIYTFWIECQPFNRSLSSTWPLTLDAVQERRRSP